MTSIHASATETPIIDFAGQTAIPKPRRKAKDSELQQLRDALPFFKNGQGAEPTSWWNVTPTGDYATDLATGQAYARDFLPMLMFNAGASSLATIISDMAKAGRDPGKTPKTSRGIDNIALGFMMQIGDCLQSVIVGIAIAAAAIKQPESDLSAKFVEQLENGNLLRGASRSTLFHDPNASIFDRH
ncbi:hypothetical protein SAMN05216374_1002 [Tardiphaga sp. OK246]|uniref:hypothetical protein n=1 Tax=Tardiphaga sp. OK246 TaxID=1855307 RepID=UPI000B62B04D|nr:hypothetical protein [Tardiphaga sp. OK246]SNS36778.1 hypothetical protein SAMN05216374_1002 [Tardiphaga sp. OK246]